MSREHSDDDRAEILAHGSAGNTLLTVLITALVVALIAAAREAAFARNRVPTAPQR